MRFLICSLIVFWGVSGSVLADFTDCVDDSECPAPERNIYFCDKNFHKCFLNTPPEVKNAPKTPLLPIISKTPKITSIAVSEEVDKDGVSLTLIELPVSVLKASDQMVSLTIKNNAYLTNKKIIDFPADNHSLDRGYPATFEMTVNIKNPVPENDKKLEIYDISTSITNYEKGNLIEGTIKFTVRFGNKYEIRFKDDKKSSKSWIETKQLRP